VFNVSACFGFLIGRSGASVHSRSDALLGLDQRVRSVTGLARPVELRASGRCVEHVRSVVRERSRYVIGASGQFDQRVRSV
jgi:hypothetical protein